MKKLLLYSGPLCVLVFTLLYSCHKDKLEGIHDVSIYQLKDYEMSATDELYFNKLLKFHNEIDTISEDSLYASTWNLSADSTVWYLRAYFNAIYCKSTLNYTNVITDSIYVNLGINYGGIYNLNDVCLAFKNIKLAIADSYSTLEYNNKELFFVYFNEIISENNRSYAVVLVLFGIDPGSEGEPSLWEPFEENEDWWFGKKLGHCDWTAVGQDAAERIEYYLNTHVPGSYYVPPAPPGHHYIYDPDSNPIIRFGYEYLNPNDSEPGDNEEDYLIYYCTETNGEITYDNKCLDGPELNFYYFSEVNIITDILPYELNQEPNWVFRSCDLRGEELSEGSITRHYNILYFATRRLVMDSLPGTIQIDD